MFCTLSLSLFWCKCTHAKHIIVIVVHPIRTSRCQIIFRFLDKWIGREWSASYTHLSFAGCYYCCFVRYSNVNSFYFLFICILLYFSARVLFCRLFFFFFYFLTRSLSHCWVCAVCWGSVAHFNSFSRVLKLHSEHFIWYTVAVLVLGVVRTFAHFSLHIQNQKLIFLVTCSFIQSLVVVVVVVHSVGYVFFLFFLHFSSISFLAHAVAICFARLSPLFLGVFVESFSCCVFSSKKFFYFAKLIWDTTIFTAYENQTMNTESTFIFLPVAFILAVCFYYGYIVYVWLFFFLFRRGTITMIYPMHSALSVHRHHHRRCHRRRRRERTERDFGKCLQFLQKFNM